MVEPSLTVREAPGRKKRSPKRPMRRQKTHIETDFKETAWGKETGFI